MCAWREKFVAREGSLLGMWPAKEYEIFEVRRIPSGAWLILVSNRTAAPAVSRLLVAQDDRVFFGNLEALARAHQRWPTWAAMPSDGT
jgi:hypothetical protein